MRITMPKASKATTLKWVGQCIDKAESFAINIQRPAEQDRDSPAAIKSMRNGFATWKPSRFGTITITLDFGE